MDRAHHGLGLCESPLIYNKCKFTQRRAITENEKHMPFADPHKQDCGITEVFATHNPVVYPKQSTW